MAESQNDMQEALTALRLWRDQIEARTETLKHELKEIANDAQAQAWMIKEGGLHIGESGNRLFTGGEEDLGAPKIHPVWAPELASEAERLERMGAATFEYEGTREQLRIWEAARPEFEYDRRGDFYLYMTGPQYDQWLAGGEERQVVEQHLTVQAQHAGMTGEVYILNPYGNTSGRVDVPALDGPYAQLDIDTSDPEMGPAWQQTLDRLQARLDALEQGVPLQQVAQEHSREQGMGY
jgi:hypothetical protein